MINRNNHPEKDKERKSNFQEIERKFLVEEVPDDLEKYPSVEIDQGYISTTEEGQEVRLRKETEKENPDKYIMTVKVGKGQVREEREVEISESQFDKLWPLTKEKRLKKKRYKIPHGEYTIELDIYKGELEGLMTCEVEFSNIDEVEEFKPPSWFREDITEDLNYKNRSLASEGLS